MTYFLFNILLIGLFSFAIISTHDSSLLLKLLSPIMRLLLLIINISSLIVGFRKREATSTLGYVSYAINLMTIAYLMVTMWLR